MLISSVTSVDKNLTHNFFLSVHDYIVGAATFTVLVKINLVKYSYNMRVLVKYSYNTQVLVLVKFSPAKYTHCTYMTLR